MPEECSRSVHSKIMTDLTKRLQARGYRLEKQDHALQVYHVEGSADFFLVESAYEFDYVNEEALLYMLSAQQPVLVHVPLLTDYEEYVESFRRYEGFPVYFLLHAAQDGELFESMLDHYLLKMTKPKV